MHRHVPAARTGPERREAAEERALWEGAWFGGISLLLVFSLVIRGTGRVILFRLLLLMRLNSGLVTMVTWDHVRFATNVYNMGINISYIYIHCMSLPCVEITYFDRSQTPESADERETQTPLVSTCGAAARPG